ncbi:DNA polymerase III subunits gamma and tau [Myroides odoratus]|uniref:DNA polymerase III subunits gamma and tau n=1 Tax=Myroides odoratus TaxID=256 RepID=A0A9Q6Z443_MYROD|nr:hypothetical protein Myrod_3604 [Myroides odoratus DSM 2801]EKB03782.1 hypothetical protein HMPREF9716_03414 [Myroides odoratus CIP 103059]QQU02003.1 hypothetical protein I6I88_08025 [Myroides odoratus]STZ31740.1 DNA polymerase III subunits gamma and tau [Myroides odoratus]
MTAVVTQLPEQAVQPVELTPVEIPITEPVSPQVVPAVVEEEVSEYKAQSQEVNTTTSPQVEPIATAPVDDNPAESPALFAVDPIVPVEKKVSALSLSSIRARKEMESSLEKKVVNPDDLPKEPFTAEQFMEEWNKYADKLARSGFMLMSSLMGMVPPVLRGTSVSLVMPNEGSKLSFDENKFDLVNYLRKKLSNYDLEIEITVNEEVKIQKRVLDKDDKLVRFIELNPAMQYMKEIFDLEFKY